jgi:hypothetical protein
MNPTKLLDWVVQKEIDLEHDSGWAKSRALHPAIAEIVGHRLMQALGFPSAPEVNVVGLDELRRCDRTKWVCKVPLTKDRLRCTSFKAAEQFYAKRTNWFLVVRKIPRAVSVAYLRDRFGIGGARWQIREFLGLPAVESFDPSKFEADASGRSALAVGCESMDAIFYLGKTPKPGDFWLSPEFYSDFSEPKDWTVVERAIAWDSDQALAIHAARLFFGTTTAHAGNLLVDGDGRLSTIDFEYCIKTDAEEFRLLFDGVERGTRTFDALRGVAALTEAQIAGLFDGTPSGFTWPLGSRRLTVTYFVERLRLWNVLLSRAN